MTKRMLGPRDLNRAVLARQLLLERSTLPLEAAIEQVGGLQTQYAPSGYVGLWTRLAGFRRDALTARAGGAPGHPGDPDADDDPHGVAARVLAVRDGRSRRPA